LEITYDSVLLRLRLRHRRRGANPTGRFRGALSSLPATELGAVAIRAALERSHIPPASVGYVIMGQVVTAGAGQNPARIAAIEAGIPMSVPAITINKVCLSGIDAIILADQLVRAGDDDIVVAGGMESMSQAPHLLPSGFGYGDVMVHDALELDGLWDYFTHQSMGALTEVANARHGGVGRAERDAFAAASHTKAAKGLEGQPVRRRSGAGVRAPTPGRTIDRHQGRGNPHRRHRRFPCRVAALVPP
jgi:acetyl-CoA C-acetyltransferase